MKRPTFKRAAVAGGRGARRFRTWLAATAVVFVCWSLEGCGGASAKTALGPPVFYPALPERPRLQFLTSFTSEEDFGQKTSAFEEFLVGKKKQKYRRLGKPYGVAVSGDKIYVADTGQKAVLVIDLKEKTFSQLAGDEGPGRVKTPINIAIDKDGHKYVADMGRAKVLVYDAKDAFVRAFGLKDQFKPSDVAVWGNRLYVCDVKGHEIEVLDRRSGKVLSKIGKAGSEPGHFVFPTNMALDAKGNIYVTDTANFRVQKFSPKGKLLGSFGTAGDTFGTFTRPKGVAVDPKGRIYVVDAAFENVQIFDDKFRLLLIIGGPGTGRGNLYLPADVEIVKPNPAIEEYLKPYVDSRLRLEYLVFAVSQYGPRLINVYGMGEWTAPLPELKFSDQPKKPDPKTDQEDAPKRSFAQPVTGTETPPLPPGGEAAQETEDETAPSEPPEEAEGQETEPENEGTEAEAGEPSSDDQPAGAEDVQSAGETAAEPDGDNSGE